MISYALIVLIGVIGVILLLASLVLMLFYSGSKKCAGNEKNKVTSDNEEQRRKEILARYQDKNMKNYLLTYLQSCYGAFIAIFIGIVAVPFLPISSTPLKLIMVVGFWIVGAYYLASIIYTYGQLTIAYRLSDNVFEDMGREVAELGFPYTWLEWLFKHLRKPRLGRLNAKYIGILLGYFLLLVIFILIVYQYPNSLS